MTETTVLIATPAYDQRVHAGYVTSLISTVIHLRDRRIRPAICFQSRPAVHLSRNEFTWACLNGDFSQLCMIDADMRWPEDAIAKLIAHRQDVVGTVAQCRHSGSFAIENPRPVPGSELLEVDSLGTGMVLLSRRWCLRMCSEYPPPRGPFEFFAAVGCSGEDTVAFQRWKDCGGRLYVDPTIEMGHYGETLLSQTWAEAQAEAERTGVPIKTMTFMRDGEVPAEVA